MNEPESPYPGHRFPREIVSRAVWLYYRFGLSLRDDEDLLAERGIIVSYETIRQWSRKFGLDYARRLRRKQGQLGDHWFLAEMFVRIQGKMQYLWRARMGIPSTSWSSPDEIAEQRNASSVNS